MLVEKPSLAFLSGQTRAVNQLIRTERFDLSLQAVIISTHLMSNALSCSKVHATVAGTFLPVRPLPSRHPSPGPCDVISHV